MAKTSTDVTPDSNAPITYSDLTDDMVSALRAEALAAGDESTAEDCATWLWSTARGSVDFDGAERRIVKVINDARAMIGT